MVWNTKRKLLWYKYNQNKKLGRKNVIRYWRVSKLLSFIAYIFLVFEQYSDVMDFLTFFYITGYWQKQTITVRLDTSALIFILVRDCS